MRLVDDIPGRMHGIATYELPNGKYIRFDERALKLYGLAAMLEAAGEEVPTGRVPVYQSGKQVGTAPAIFDPTTTVARSFFYDMRPGDFVRDGDGWTANPMLGPGDLSAVPGFQWSDDPLRAERDMEEDRTILREALFARP
jgi:hypothetical protein